MDVDVALYSSSGTAAHAHDWPSIERPERLSQIEDALRARPSSSAAYLATAAGHGRRIAHCALRAYVAEVARLSQSAAEHPGDRDLREPDGKGGLFGGRR